MNDLKLFRRLSLVESCSTSLPGGDQVDGLPPAASCNIEVKNEEKIRKFLKISKIFTKFVIFRRAAN